MIKFLSNWIEGITISVIIASIFEMIIPKGNIKKYVKIVLGIYIVFNIISPILNDKYKIENINETIQGYSDNFKSFTEQKNDSNANLDRIYINTLEKDIVKTIENEGYNVYKCNVKGIFDANKKNIGINKIEIVLYSNKIENKTQKEEKENTIKIEEVNEVEKVEINIDNQKALDKGKINLKDIDTLRNFLSKHYEINKDIIEIQVR